MLTEGSDAIIQPFKQLSGFLSVPFLYIEVDSLRGPRSNCI